MTVRVAAAQFATGLDVGENLASCLRLLDLAAAQAAQLVVLPEFCNQLSWYDDAAQAWAGALDPDGAFLKAIADAARRHRFHVVINVALRRPARRITVTSLLFGSDGALLAEADKQTLMGHENIWFARAERNAPVVATPFGRLGLFPCRDGVTCETPRGLALRGAQLFCDSLNSFAFAFDEAALHVPARAVENKTFIVAANKIGPLIPQALLEQVSAATNIPVPYLFGAGESQIVAPDGTVLARAPRDREALICAELDLTLADDKRRPDGSDLFAMRRPELYDALLATSLPCAPRAAADTLDVALLCPWDGGAACTDNDIDGVLALLAALPDSTRIAVLPELPFFADGRLGDVQTALLRSAQWAQRLRAALAGRALLICTTLVEMAAGGAQHVGVLIGADGVLARQPQLHRTARHAWMNPGNEIRLFDLPEARIAMLVGDDAALPEVARCAALRGAQLLLVPGDIQERWEVQFGLPARAAENRVCVAAASRPRVAGAGLVATLERDFTLLTPWPARRFDGLINFPLLTPQRGPLTLATVHPQAANNKQMSSDTDLLAGRPWRLAGALAGLSG